MYSLILYDFRFSLYLDHNHDLPLQERPKEKYNINVEDQEYFLQFSCKKHNSAKFCLFIFFFTDINHLQVH